MALFDERQPMCIPTQGCRLGLSNTGKTMPQPQPANLPNYPPRLNSRDRASPDSEMRGSQICYAPRQGRPATGATSYMSPLALALRIGIGSGSGLCGRRPFWRVSR